MSDNRMDLSKAALLSMEMQRGVIGDRSTIEPLVEAIARRGTVSALARVMQAARKAGATVVHCNAEFRADLKGSGRNSPMLRYVTRNPTHIVSGSEGAEVVPELAPQAEDLVFRRFHGLSPFTGTSLDITLRNLNVDTVVAAGVSVNMGVFGMCLEAVNLGYRVILPRDCVGGFPDAYVDSVVDNSLSLLATLTTSDEVVAAWERTA